MKKLTGNLGAGRSASGGNAGLTISKSGTLAFAVTRPDRPGDIAVMESRRQPSYSDRY